MFPLLEDLAPWLPPWDTHSTLVMIALVAAGIVFLVEKRRRRVDDPRIVYLVLGALVGAAIFSRLGTWAQHLDPSQNLSLVDQLARGNASMLSALVGAWAGVHVAKRIVRYPHRSGDLFAPAVALALAIGRARGTISAGKEAEIIKGLIELPRHIAALLRNEQQFTAIAQDLSKAKDVLYLGRGTSYPIALEGALKLKEISYIHAEGYAAGELKHGPIALIDENVPVIVVAPEDDLFEKTISNMQEVAARGGQIILISDAPAEKVSCKLAAHIQMPKVSAFMTPLLYAVPTQLLAYHTAVVMGTDVDQPRNLAKSVTVE